jgi:hypothetical protein
MACVSSSTRTGLARGMSNPASRARAARTFMATTTKNPTTQALPRTVSRSTAAAKGTTMDRTSRTGTPTLASDDSFKTGGRHADEVAWPSVWIIRSGVMLVRRRFHEIRLEARTHDESRTAAHSKHGLCRCGTVSGKGGRGNQERLESQTFPRRPGTTRRRAIGAPPQPPPAAPGGQEAETRRRGERMRSMTIPERGRNPVKGGD